MSFFNSMQNATFRWPNTSSAWFVGPSTELRARARTAINGIGTVLLHTQFSTIMEAFQCYANKLTHTHTIIFSLRCVCTKTINFVSRPELCALASLLFLVMKNTKWAEYVYYFIIYVRVCDEHAVSNAALEWKTKKAHTDRQAHARTHL